MAGSTVFEHHSDRYETWFETYGAVYQSELAAIRTLLPPEGKGLEIGVGSGLFAAPLGIRHGIDPSPAMLEKARARGIDVTRGVAENLPYREATFDYALMVTTVCFLDDLSLAFEEAYRILKPGGTFLIGFVDRDSSIGRSYEAGKNDSLFYREATFYSVPELRTGLQRAGFRDLQYVQTLFHPLRDMKEIEPVREGHGEGSFIVIAANKGDRK